LTSNQSKNIVIRAKNFRDLPDVENSIHILQKKGILKKLANEKKINAKELKKFLLSRFVDIFQSDNLNLKIGDIVIFGFSGNYQLFTSTSVMFPRQSLQ